MTGPRIALCGIALESNAFSPVATEEAFRTLCYVEGEALLDEARAAVSVISREMTGFVRAMDVTGPWRPVPLVLAAAHPWGPVDHEFFVRVVDDIIARLEAAGGADAVYVANHGAMVSTQEHRSGRLPLPVPARGAGGGHTRSSAPSTCTRTCPSAWSSRATC